jgi:hypothetical protein
MPSLLNSLQQYIEDVFPESIVDRCKEESCSLNLRGLPCRIIVKGERTCDDKICDCIIVLEENNNIKLCIVELKSKKLHPRDIPEKLCNGAHIAFDIFKRCDVNAPKPLFLVLHKGTTSSDHQVLSRKRANLHGEGYPIRIKRCGSSLSDLLEDL